MSLSKVPHTQPVSQTFMEYREIDKKLEEIRALLDKADRRYSIDLELHLATVKKIDDLRAGVMYRAAL